MDPLALSVMDGYRYRDSLSTKSKIQDKIRKLSAGEPGSSGETPKAKRPKKLPEVYLVNKQKFHSVATEEELQREITEETMDEKAHQIIQFKIR